MTTAPATRHSQVHFYFDESGLLHGLLERDELLQVVSAVVLGPPPEAELIDLLDQSVTAAQGAFPSDLHVEDDDSLSRRQFAHRVRMRTVHELPQRLARRPDLGAILIGAAVRHERDLAPGGGLLTGEPRADNRYQRMLIELLQHLLFVVPVLRQRLAPDAEVFLHLASRKVIFKPGQATRAQLEALGYRARDHHKPPGSLRVGLTLEAKELIALLRGTLQQTGPHSAMHLPVLPSVTPINYDPGQPLSPAGLYLADLFLFQGRNRFSEQNDLLTAPGLFPTEVLLAYGPDLQRQTQRNAALARGDGGRYLDLSCQPDGLLGPPSSDGAAVWAAEEPQAARLMAEPNVTPERLADPVACAFQRLRDDLRDHHEDRDAFVQLKMITDCLETLVSYLAFIALSARRDWEVPRGQPEP